MPLVYMNSWASLAVRAGALAVFGLAVLSGSARAALAATALLLAASAAHPLSLSLRLGGSAAGVLSLAEGMVAFALASMLALAAGRDAGVAAHAAAPAAPLAIGLALLALVSGGLQRERVRTADGGRGPLLPVAIGLGSAGVALLVALQAQAIGAEGRTVPALAVAAFALAAWITHCALRLRRARRTSMHALQRDWVLVRLTRRSAAAPAPRDPTPAARRLHPAAQWS
jgi:hypothetical protein